MILKVDGSSPSAYPIVNIYRNVIEYDKILKKVNFNIIVILLEIHRRKEKFRLWVEHWEFYLKVYDTDEERELLKKTEKERKSKKIETRTFINLFRLNKQLSVNYFKNDHKAYKYTSGLIVGSFEELSRSLRRSDKGWEFLFSFLIKKIDLIDNNIYFNIYTLYSFNSISEDIKFLMRSTDKKHIILCVKPNVNRFNIKLKKYSFIKKNIRKNYNME